MQLTLGRCYNINMVFYDNGLNIQIKQGYTGVLDD